MTEIIITGCGNSGTGWAAAVMNQLGVKCGHESVFNHAELQRRPPWADSSWAAIPFLDRHPRASVVWIVRNPIRVVRSATRIGFLGDGAHFDTPYANFVRRHRPDIFDAADHLGRLIRWVARWDEPASLRSPPYRIEDADPQMLVEWGRRIGRPVSETGASKALAAVGTTVNTHAPTSTADRHVTWSRIARHPDGPELVERARRFGYSTEEAWK